MARQNSASTEPIDCACVIHGSGYSWDYVERLRNMLLRNLSPDIRFHVYTEPERKVPAHMIKHDLELWPTINGPKKSWWYKLQLFNPEHHQGNLLYFDLDTVIIRDVSWIARLPTQHLWGIRDFKYLQKPNSMSLNSSVMWWNVSHLSHVWSDFKKSGILDTANRFRGDQDYLQAVLGHKKMQFFGEDQVQSWRWQCVDGGYDFKSRHHRKPGQGTQFNDNTSVLVFHGNPKPHQINDKVVQEHWR